jgi:hypothetical protein
MKFIITHITQRPESNSTCDGYIAGFWEWLNNQEHTGIVVESRLTPSVPPLVVSISGKRDFPIQFHDVPYNPNMQFHVLRFIDGKKYPELWQSPELVPKSKEPKFSLQKELTWTTEKPTAPGLYLWRPGPNNNTRRLLNVFHFSDQLMICENCLPPMWPLVDRAGQFAGPIPEPKEAK